jgi:hypothetical protein
MVLIMTEAMKTTLKVVLEKLAIMEVIPGSFDLYTACSVTIILEFLVENLVSCEQILGKSAKFHLAISYILMLYSNDHALHTSFLTTCKRLQGILIISLPACGHTKSFVKQRYTTTLNGALSNSFSP